MKPSYKELEAKLKELEITNKLYEKSSIVKFIWKKGENWPVEYVTKNVKALFGYSANDFVNNRVYYKNIIHPTDLPGVAKEVEEINKSTKSFFEHQPYRIITKSNQVKWIKDTTLILRNAKNEITHYEGIIIDITERKQAEEALEKSEYLLKQTQEITKTGGWVYDVSTGKTEFTDETYKIFGIPKGTVITPEEGAVFYHPDDREKVFQAFTKAIEEKKAYDLEVRFINKQGNELWVRTMGHPVVEKGKVVKVIGNLMDITDKKMTELKLSDSEAKYRSLYENAPLSYQSLNPDGTFRDVNPTWLDTLGYERNEVIGKNYADFLHPDWKKHFEKNFPEFKKRGYIDDVQFKIKHKKGHYLDISFNGCIGYYPDGRVRQTYCVFQDITYRKQAEEALIKSESKLKEAQVLAKIGDFTWNIVTGEVTWSDNMFKLLKYDKDEKIDLSKVNAAIHHPDDLERVTKWLNDCLASGNEKLTPNEYRLVCHDGEVLEIHTEGIITYENGKPVSVFGMCQDITERKQAEKLIQESELKYRKIFSENPNIMMLADFRKQILVDVNEAYIRKLGFTREEVVHQKGKLGFAVTDKKILNHAFEQIKKADRLAGIENTSLSKSGKKLDLLVFAEPLDTSEGHLHILTAIDISERKKAEVEIKKSEERYKNLFENAPVPLWEEDFSRLVNYLDTLKKNKINEFRQYFDQHPEEVVKCAELVDVTDVNRAAIQLHKAQNKEQLLGNLNKTFTKNSLTVFKEELIALAEGKTEIESQAEVKTLDGELIYIQVKLKLDSTSSNKNKALLSTEDITEKYLLDKELDKLSHRLEDTMNSISDGVVMFDKNMNYTYVNPRGAELLGTAAEHLIGNNYFELYPEAAETIFAKNYLWVQKHRKPLQFENHYEPWDKWYENRIYPTEEGIAIYFSDITERRKVEEALRMSEEKFRLAFKTSPDSININRLEDGAYVDINEGFTKITGYTEEDVIGVSSLDINIWTDVKGRERLVAGLKKEGKYENLEALFRKKDGSTVYGLMSAVIIEINGEPHILNITRDITERKIAEAKIKESEERFRLMFKQHAAVMLLIDPQTGAILDANDSAIQFYGFPKEKLCAMKIEQINTLSPQQVAAEIENARLKKKNYFLFQHRQANGSICPVEVYSSPIKIENKNVLSSIIIDVTERKKAEDELSKYRNHLEQMVKERTTQLAEANKELEAFSYSVSHDLRAPLRGMHGFTQILMEDYAPKLDEEGLRLCNRILNNVEKMGQLIDDLLAFSRISRREIKKMQVDMKNLVHSAYHEITKKEERDKIVFELADLPPVNCDPALMNQVWMNLLSNAVKYSSRREKPVIKVSSFVQNNKVVYVVSDNGVGFNMDYADKLFGVFQRLHSSKEFEGTGIGLSIVQRIIKRHGGQVWAESRVNHGAKFFFTLPENELLTLKNNKNEKV